MLGEAVDESPSPPSSSAVASSGAAAPGGSRGTRHSRPFRNLRLLTGGPAGDRHPGRAEIVVLLRLGSGASPARRKAEQPETGAAKTPAPEASRIRGAIDGTGSGAYHFSSGTDVAIRELYDAVVKAMNLSHHPEPVVQSLGEDDVYSILLDPSRTFEDFGNIEFTSVEDTVSESIAYFREYGILGEYTHLRLGKE